MLHIFTIEYRGNAPTLPVDVYEVEYDELRVPTLFFLLENTSSKKLKRKLSNALESFLYNCATRFKGHIVVRQCPPVPFLQKNRILVGRYGG